MTILSIIRCFAVEWTTWGPSGLVSTFYPFCCERQKCSYPPIRHGPSFGTGPLDTVPLLSRSPLTPCLPQAEQLWIIVVDGAVCRDERLFAVEWLDGAILTTLGDAPVPPPHSAILPPFLPHAPILPTSCCRPTPIPSTTSIAHLASHESPRRS